MGGYATHAGWAEFDFNYSRILIQNKTSFLTGGFTLAYMKGLSGAFADVSNVNFVEQQKSDTSYYLIKQAAVTAGYSANYGLTTAGRSSGQLVRDFLRNTLSSPGLSMGAEFLFKADAEGGASPVDAGNYDWKLGMSIMDIGANRFYPVNGSFTATTVLPAVTDTTIQNQTKNITGIEGLRYKMLDVFKSVDTLNRQFTISLPTRMVLYADKNLGSNFYINGQVNINFYSTQPNGPLKTRELNLLTLTPRWETEAWGVYLPVQYNTQGMLWVGAAIKLGPLLIGVHSLDFYKWFKTGTQNYNGGGYILLSIHPFRHKEEPDAMPCPKA